MRKNLKTFIFLCRSPFNILYNKEILSLLHFNLITKNWWLWRQNLNLIVVIRLLQQCNLSECCVKRIISVIIFVEVKFVSNTCSKILLTKSRVVELSLFTFPVRQKKLLITDSTTNCKEHQHVNKENAQVKNKNPTCRLYLLVYYHDF